MGQLVIAVLGIKKRRPSTRIASSGFHRCQQTEEGQDRDRWPQKDIEHDPGWNRVASVTMDSVLLAVAEQHRRESTGAPWDALQGVPFELEDGFDVADHRNRRRASPRVLTTMPARPVFRWWGVALRASACGSSCSDRSSPRRGRPVARDRGTGPVSSITTPAFLAAPASHINFSVAKALCRAPRPVAPTVSSPADAMSLAPVRFRMSFARVISSDVSQ